MPVVVEKFAVTVASAVRVTRHVDEVPEHPLPLQPVNPAPLAVSVTGVALSKVAEQFEVQPLMPTGFEFTVPVPVPVTTTVSVGRLKFAVVLELAVIVKLQSPVVLLHALGLPSPLPLPFPQPVKLDALLGVAWSVRLVPAL